MFETEEERLLRLEVKYYDKLISNIIEKQKTNQDATDLAEKEE